MYKKSKQGGIIKRSLADEQKRLDIIKQKNEEVRNNMRAFTAKESQEVRGFNQEQRRLKAEEEERKRKWEADKPRREKAEDRAILNQLNLEKLVPSDRSAIDMIHNDRIRSRLQHEIGLQTSDFYKNLKSVNKPTNDEFVANAWDMALGEVPYVKDAKSALGVKVTSKESNVKNYFNKAYAELLEQYPELADGSYDPDTEVGSGLAEFFNRFNKKQDFNNISTECLRKYGNCRIKSIVVARRPIMKILDHIINAISLGKWAELKKKYNYDDLFHLGILINLDDNGRNKILQYEKVNAVSISEKISLVGHKVQNRQMNVNQSITLNEAVQMTINRVGKEKYFDYSGLGRNGGEPNNCQYFCKYFLETIGCWTPTIRNFTMQDLNELSREFPEYAKAIMNVITDTAQIYDNVSGAGLTIHSVQVDQNIPFLEARKIAHHILKTKRHFKEKIIGTHYHFKNRPKTHFKPRSWRTKKVNDDVNIVFGVLKDDK